MPYSIDKLYRAADRLAQSLPVEGPADLSREEAEVVAVIYDAYLDAANRLREERGVSLWRLNAEEYRQGKR